MTPQEFIGLQPGDRIEYTDFNFISYPQILRTIHHKDYMMGIGFSIFYHQDDKCFETESGKAHFHNSDLNRNSKFVRFKTRELMCGMNFVSFFNKIQFIQKEIPDHIQQGEGTPSPISQGLYCSCKSPSIKQVEMIFSTFNLCNGCKKEIK